MQASASACACQAVCNACIRPSWRRCTCLSQVVAASQVDAVGQQRVPEHMVAGCVVHEVRRWQGAVHTVVRSRCWASASSSSPSASSCPVVAAGADHLLPGVCLWQRCQIACVPQHVRDVLVALLTPCSRCVLCTGPSRWCAVTGPCQFFRPALSI